ncbi:MAG: DMT family transporter [Synergistaceae bacterium]|nr:DMT family transporter [Synergistaceae bacterium]
MLADLALLFCAFFWGMSFASMKILVTIYPSCWLLFLRFTAGALMIYVFFHRRIHESLRKCLNGGMLIGALLFVALTSQTVGLQYIGGGRSAFISAIYVLIVPLMLWALRKKFPGWVTLFAACLCIAGMYFLTDDDMSGSMNIGDILTIICAITFAVQILAINHYTQDCDPITLSFVEFITLSGLSFITSLIFETRNELISMNGIYELIFTIVLCTFGCYMIQICAQKYAKPSHAAIIMSLESVFGLLSGIVFLGETITLRASIGCAMIFASVLIAELEPFIHIKTNRG